MAVGENDLTDLVSVKEYLRLTNTATDSNALLQTLITNVSAFIETYTNRIFKETDYVDRVNGIGFPCVKIAFSNFPVTAVSSLMIDDFNIPPAMSVTQPGYLFSDQFLGLNGYFFSKGFQNIVVSYTAGYSVIPFDIAQSCNQIVALRYRELERVGQISKSVNGENVAFSKDAMPADVLLTLNQYRKVVLV